MPNWIWIVFFSAILVAFMVYLVIKKPSSSSSPTSDFPSLYGQDRTGPISDLTNISSFGTQKIIGGYVENWKDMSDLTQFQHCNVLYYAFMTLAPNPHWENIPTALWNGDHIYETYARVPMNDVPGSSGNDYVYKRIEPLILDCQATNRYFILALGGWSDSMNTITDDQIPRLVEEMIEGQKVWKANGWDFDWEHLSNSNDPVQQRAILGKVIPYLRRAMEADSAISNDSLLSITLRFNMFFPVGTTGFSSDGESIDIWKSGQQWARLSENTQWANAKYKEKFGTDGSWPENPNRAEDWFMNAIISNVNIMAYDNAANTWSNAPGKYFSLDNYNTIYQSFEPYLESHKIVMGFEPSKIQPPVGNPGSWSGPVIDSIVIKDVVTKNRGGVFWWAMNDAAPGWNALTNGQVSGIMSNFALCVFSNSPNCEEIIKILGNWVPPGYLSIEYDYSNNTCIVDNECGSGTKSFKRRTAPIGTTDWEFMGDTY